MKVLIIEDERPAQRMLQGMLSELRPAWEIAGVLDCIESSVAWLNENPHPDLIFLDIQLSDGLSFEILKKVKTRSMIIFITAYDKYALQAFKVNSIDYLLKPVKKEDLEKALEKYESYSKSFIEKSNALVDYDEILNIVKGARDRFRKRFLVSSGDEFIRLAVEDIAYFSSSQRVTFAHTFKDKRFIIDLTLEKLEQQLNDEIFFRVNRKFILNMEAIAKIEPWFNNKLSVKTNPPFPEDIIISREKAPLFKRWLDR